MLLITVDTSLQCSLYKSIIVNIPQLGVYWSSSQTHSIDTCSNFVVSDLHKRLRVTLINAQGLDEPGIDGGGLFCEFLSETIKTGYNPNRGYFTSFDEGTLTNVYEPLLAQS